MTTQERIADVLSVHQWLERCETCTCGWSPPDNAPDEDAHAYHTWHLAKTIIDVVDPAQEPVSVVDVDDISIGDEVRITIGSDLCAVVRVDKDSLIAVKRIENIPHKHVSPPLFVVRASPGGVAEYIGWSADGPIWAADRAGALTFRGVTSDMLDRADKTGTSLISPHSGFVLPGSWRCGTVAYKSGCIDRSKLPEVARRLMRGDTDLSDLLEPSEDHRQMP